MNKVLIAYKPHRKKDIHMPLAVLCHTYGHEKDLVIQSIERVPLHDHQIRVAVKSVGLNFFDTLIIRNKYQQKPSLPFSPGGEISGEVIEVGHHVHELKPGDAVAAYCGYGGCQEEIILEAEQAILLPPKINHTLAASMLITYGTAYLALIRRANMSAGEKICVLGAAGGVGTAAMDIAKSLKGHVIATASSHDKEQYCLKRGADICLDYTDENFKQILKKYTHPSGVDIVFDAVGGPKSIDALRTLQWGGRFLVVGFASGGITNLPLNLVLLKNIDVMGIHFGLYTQRFSHLYKKDIYTLCDWIVNKKISPIVTHTAPLEHTPTLIHRIANRDINGKAVIEITSS